MIKMLRKGLFVGVLFLGSIMVLNSCSSSRKLKKKCRDCPEFSLYDKTNTDALIFDERGIQIFIFSHLKNIPIP